MALYPSVARSGQQPLAHSNGKHHGEVMLRCRRWWTERLQYAVVLGMAVVQDELAAANPQTSSYESAQVKARASKIPISGTCIAPART